MESRRKNSFSYWNSSLCNPHNSYYNWNQAKSKFILWSFSMNSKKAAIELSIGTVVIIVLAMSMLILGLVLIRNIFGGATESVDNLNEKVRSEITNLFAEDSSKLAIRLGADKTAIVKQGNRLGVAFGAQAASGQATTTDMKYTLELMENTDTECRNDFKNYFTDYRFGGDFKTTSSFSFETIDGPNGFSIIVLDVPETAKPCEQRIRITLTDSSQATPGTQHTDVFRVKVEPKGIFS